MTPFGNLSGQRSFPQPGQRPMPTLKPPRSLSVSDLLDVQAARRALHVPVLSVLAGPPPAALRTWKLWADRACRPSVACTRPGLDDVCLQVVDHLATTRDLISDAVAGLACWAGLTPDRMRGRLGGMTCADLDVLLRSVGPTGAPDAVALCSGLVRRLVIGDLPPGQVLLGEVARDLGWDARPSPRVLAALYAIVPEAGWPALLFLPAQSAELDGWFGGALRAAAALVGSLPRWSVGVAAPADVVDRYRHAAPESKAVALLREGLIQVPAADPGAVAREVAAAAGPQVGVEAAIEQVASRGGDGLLVASLVEAAHAVDAVSPTDPETVDRARSRAERFLYELLDSHPQTAGLFEPNGELDFRFGPRPAEVDLLCRSLRVAVELDGAYWHLGDADAYRRDRRKDWELQRRGYLVVRFLAEDVVRRLQDTLDTILAAVALRHEPNRATGDHPR